MPYANIEDRRRNSREYYLRNKAKIQDYGKRYRESHREEIKERRARPAVKEYHRKKAREYYRMHKEEMAARARKWRAMNPEKVKEYRESNREVLKMKKKAWVRANKERVNAHMREYRRTNKAIREYLVESSRWHYAEIDERCREDAGYYAEQRAKARGNYAKRRLKAGHGYSPNVARRVPDTQCKGGARGAMATMVECRVGEAARHLGGTWISMPTARLAKGHMKRWERAV